MSDEHNQLTETFSKPMPTDAEIASAIAMANRTIPSRPPAATIRRVIEAVAKKPADPPVALTLDNTPWTLQQFFNGEIDLDTELAQRFQGMPVMAAIHVRTIGTKSKRGVATLTTQDGSAQVIIDVDAVSKVVQLSFSFGSMLSLRFGLTELNDTERQRWLELMRRKEGGLTFLWGPSRWEKDYLICVVRRHFTNLYAFSAHNFEASVRMTPSVTQTLLNWLESFWTVEIHADEQPPLLTW